MTSENVLKAQIGAYATEAMNLLHWSGLLCVDGLIIERINSHAHACANTLINTRTRNGLYLWRIKWDNEEFDVARKIFWHPAVENATSTEFMHRDYFKFIATHETDMLDEWGRIVYGN